MAKSVAPLMKKATEIKVGGEAIISVKSPVIQSPPSMKQKIDIAWIRSTMILPILSFLRLADLFDHLGRRLLRTREVFWGLQLFILRLLSAYKARRHSGKLSMSDIEYTSTLAEFLSSVKEGRQYWIVNSESWKKDKEKPAPCGAGMGRG